MEEKTELDKDWVPQTVQMEEVGQIRSKTQSVTSKALVVTDGWPSLLFVLHSLGFKLITFISNKDLYITLNSLFGYINPIWFR